MLSLFKKKSLLALLALFSMNSSLMAWEYCDSCECNRLYVGVFGGGMYSNSSKVYQMGTAFFTEAAGGPLAVNARGLSKGVSSGFGGIQLGYELPNYPLNIGDSGWTIAPAGELEAFWYKVTKTASLNNETDRLDGHVFLDSFDINAGVYLANAVFSLNNPNFGAFSPYIGGGIGATRMSLTNATSTQTDPPEIGVNHFNSKRNDSAWTFAAQAKAGLRYHISESFHIFGEYRYLFVDSSNYIFGSAVYPTHVPTSPWNVKLQNIQYNAFVFGIQYDL